MKAKKKKLKVETVADFLKRGGKITKLKEGPREKMNWHTPARKEDVEEAFDKYEKDLLGTKTVYKAYCDSPACTKSRGKKQRLVKETEKRSEIPSECPRCGSKYLYHETVLDPKFKELRKKISDGINPNFWTN